MPETPPNNFTEIPLSEHPKSDKAVIPTEVVDSARQEATEEAERKNEGRGLFKKLTGKEKVSPEELMPSGDQLHSTAVKTSVKQSLRENVDQLKREQNEIGNIILNEKLKSAEKNLESLRRRKGMSKDPFFVESEIRRAEAEARDLRYKKAEHLQPEELQGLIDKTYLPQQAIESLGTEVKSEVINISTIEHMLETSEVFALGPRGVVPDVIRITSVDDLKNQIRINGKDKIKFVSIPKQRVASLGLDKNFSGTAYSSRFSLGEGGPITYKMMTFEQFLASEAEVRKPEEIEKMRAAFEQAPDPDDQRFTDPKTEMGQAYWLQKAQKLGFDL